jgi:antitoxin VapB
MVEAGIAMAALNIQNDEVVRHVKELADRECKSMTAVVREAVEAQLERTRSTEVQSEGLADRLLTIGRSTAPLWRETWRSTPHGDLLYDEWGLPK